MRIFAIRTFFITLLMLLFFNEYLIYILKAFLSWPTISCNGNEPCSKILLVADPQILGEFKENFFSRFDCDKYLRNTFSVAFDHVNPDGVIFLGDLEDEGSLANDEQFERYYQRFRNIFRLERLYASNIPVVFIPGDNDIGGEGDEVIRTEVTERFRKYFGQEDTAIIKNIKVFKVNKLLHIYPPAKDSSLDGNITLNLVLSHIPLFEHLSLFTSEVLRNVKPDFIFSAHEHKSYAVLTLREGGKQLYYEELRQNSFKNGLPTWTFQASRTSNYTMITELIVPTCSYRMGVLDVGYGVIVQNHNKPAEIAYHVLWLPSRFVSLFLYSLLLVVSVLAAGLRWRKVQRKYRKRYGRF